MSDERGGKTTKMGRNRHCSFSRLSPEEQIGKRRLGERITDSGGSAVILNPGRWPGDDLGIKPFGPIEHGRSRLAALSAGGYNDRTG